MANIVLLPRISADSPSGLDSEGRERDWQPGSPRKIHHGPETSISLAEDTVAGYFFHHLVPIQRLTVNKNNDTTIFLLTEESR